MNFGMDRSNVIRLYCAAFLALALLIPALAPAAGEVDSVEVLYREHCGQCHGNALSGGNYGWPLRTLGIHYDGSPWIQQGSAVDLLDPSHNWTPSIAACGMEFYTGSAFPRWHGDLLIGSLGKQELHRLDLKNQNVIGDEILLKNMGRIRDVATGPDGLIYIIANPSDKNGSGAVYRLVPFLQ